MSETVIMGLITLAGVAIAAWLSDRRTNRRIGDMRTETREAHAGINERITAVDERSERRHDSHRAALDAQRTALESMARDVSFMAGRQAERDHRSDIAGT